MITLKLRKDAGANHKIWFVAEDENGKRWSVLDCGELMKSAPESPAFKGWESIELGDKGELMHDTLTRAPSKKELLKLLTK